MSDTTFVTGTTVITSNWAQDVNTVTYRRGVDIQFYGAVGDGTTDCTSAFNSAVAALPYGGTIYVPIGTYKVSSAITLTAGITIQGTGPTSSTITTSSASANIFDLAAGCAVMDLKMISSVTRTTGYYVNILGNGCTVDNCEFENYYIGVSAGTIPGTLIVAPRVSNCRFRTPAVSSGSGGVQFIYCSNAEMYNVIMTGEVGTQASFGLRIQAGDTAFIDSCNITVHGKALLMDTPAGYSMFALDITSCCFDSAGVITGPSNASNAELVPAGDIKDTKITNTWFGISSAAHGCVLSPTGAGTINGIEFVGCEFVDNGDNGLYVVGSAVTNWKVTGGWAAGNTNKGIYVNGASVNFTIVGFAAGNIAGRGTNDYGIALSAAASDKFVIADCNLEGNTSANMFDGSTGTSGIITGNRGYNWGSFTTLTPSGSPYIYTAGHSPEVVYVYGDTVSAISQSGIQIASGSNLAISLAPNEACGITYTVAPTVRKKVL